MKPWAESFYKSKTWQQCRDGYVRSVGGLCEVCLAQGLYTPGVIVHHIVHLTTENIKDPTITLDWNNLQLVCRACHEKAHKRTAKRWKIDSNGCVSAIEDPPI